MKPIIKLSFLSLLAISYCTVAKAQQSDDMFKASNANMILIQAGKRSVYMLKEVAAVLTEDDNQLRITVPLYDSILNKAGMTAPGSITPVILTTTITINPGVIQDNLTSSKQFVVRGNLVVNKINKPVEVSYIPMASGTEEQGNFNMFITIQFDPSDFKLTVPSVDSRCVIQISNAPVNRR